MNGLADARGCALGVGLAGVEPGDHRFEGERGNEPCRPVPPRAGRDDVGEVMLGDLRGGRANRVDDIAELRLPCRVAKQNPSGSAAAARTSAGMLA